MSFPRDQTTPASADQDLLETLDRLGQDVRSLRKAVLKHGHAQELFQQRIEEAVGRLADGRPGPGAQAEISEVQLRVLLELDKALVHLLGLARGESPRQDQDGLGEAPESVREGLDLLQIRVRNLQRSFGLEPIRAVGAAFDDRLHQAHSLCHHPDLPEGRVVEEILPGYLLDGKVVRPALVIVNRNAQDAFHAPAGEEEP